MLKGNMLLGVYIAALVAFAAPGAQAVNLVDEEGTLSKGVMVSVVGTNIETVLTGVGTIKCEPPVFHAEVTEDGSAQVHLKGAGEVIPNKCMVPITDATIGTVVINSIHKGSISGIRFFVDLLGCELFGSLGLGLATGTDEISVSGTLPGTGICLGGLHVKGSFTLETTASGSPVSIVE